MKDLFNSNWLFKKCELGTHFEVAKAAIDSFKAVELPHDWLIYDANNLYEDGSGWYYKKFFCKKEDRVYILRFEGVYMDSEVFVNGIRVKEWKYGYSTFDADITEALVNGENEIMVGVHHQSPNSRWYSGAGIYRNVWLHTLPKTHIAMDGIYISAREAQGGYTVAVDVEIEGCENSRGELTCKFEIVDPQGDVVYADVETIDATRVDSTVDAGGLVVVKANLFIKDADIWDIDNPVSYTLRTSLCEDILPIQEEETTFGCRYVEVSPNEGFSLNHRKVKLNGVCMHHDLGALGAAVNKDALRRQLRIVKEMGVNSIRTSHNMPAVELMELADEMGILIVSEGFDMWERPKTEYDYARFFPQWYKLDVRSWVRRDRNHPSLVFYSIGNEIFDMHADERGQEVTRLLKEAVEENDPRGNGLVTFGSNFMPWEGAQKCGDIVKIPGYNYSEKYYDEHHKKYPDWVIYGSETASTVQSRGIYHFPYKQSVLADVDEQCSSLGNSTTSWGAENSEACVKAERDHYYSMGQFLWTGFDYIGEPTPYHTKNSYFGQVDTAGFAKDSFYIYQAEWVKPEIKNVLHLFPYWNFNEGQTVDVRVATNASTVELFLNGKSQGKKNIDHAHGEILTADYMLEYEPGEITAVSYDESGNEILRETRHSFGESYTYRLECTDADGQVLAKNMGSAGESEVKLTVSEKKLLFLEIDSFDQNGYPVEDANDRVKVTVSGQGRLLGLDNGDSTDYDQYKCDTRRLFSGKLLAIIETTGEAGELNVSVRRQEENPWIRKIELVRHGARKFDAEHRQVEFDVKVYPTEAMAQLDLPKNGAGSGQEGIKDFSLGYEIINNSGIKIDLAEYEVLEVSEAEKQAGIAARLRVTALGDGEFRLRAYTNNGQPQVKVMSTYDFQVSGIGCRYFNPYELVIGGLHNDSIGDIGNGNEQGCATARDGVSVVGFKGVDFGTAGSDTVTLPIFELGGNPIDIGFWIGKPGTEGARLLSNLHYHKPSIWAVYQPETYKLPELLKGVQDIYFELNDKIHLKGFVFEPHSRAYDQIQIVDRDKIYGDTFTVEEDAITGIGNNVNIDFEDMNFTDGIRKIRICGRAHNEVNSIHVRFFDGTNEIRQVVEFKGGVAGSRAGLNSVATEDLTGDYNIQEFDLESITGMQKVTFVFMPGSNFDFEWFEFIK